MDWKEEVAKTAIGGILIFAASKIYKILKKGLKPAGKWTKNVFNINDTKKDVQYSIELIKVLIHFNSNPMWIMGIDGSLEYANPAWCDLTGFEEEEHAHFMGFMRCVPDRFQDLITRMNTEFIRHPNEVEWEITLMHVGTKVEFTRLCITKLIKDENQKPIKSIGILKLIN